MPNVFTPESSRAALGKRYDRQRQEREREARIREIVDGAPPLTERERARLALIILNAPEARRSG